MKYDYLSAVEEDVRTYIEGNINLADYSSKEDLYEALYDIALLLIRSRETRQGAILSTRGKPKSTFVTTSI